MSAAPTGPDLVLPARLTAPPRPTERHPWLLPLAMRVHRARRRTAWVRDTVTGRVRWARTRTGEDLPVRVAQHGSLLLRELAPDQMHLQHNKVTNLRLASERVDRLLVRPGETFSFNRVVGNATRRRGFAVGMRLSNGRPSEGVGGGLCQLANLVHWLVLHSPLTVVERSQHTFDPFPDQDRVVPWGVGCSIVYNYVDLVVRNDTDATFELRAWVGERHLHGQLLSDHQPEHRSVVEARDEEFVRRDGQVFRRNEIWRRHLDRASGEQVGEELLKRNCALVLYAPGPEVPVRDCEPWSEMTMPEWPILELSRSPLFGTVGHVLHTPQPRST